MTEQEIDVKYLAQANTLETEFFDIVDQGLPSQRRVIKPGKTTEEFNQLHGQIWKKHYDELVAGGFIVPIEPEPPIVFTPINPVMGVEHRLTHVEEFLSQLYPS